MGRGKALWLIALFCRLASAEIADGLCSYDTSQTPGLPKAMCFFPSCPSGLDCQPPAIDKSSARIEFFEPLLQWKDTCPNTQFQGACWEVHVNFRFRMAATDPSGISDIGVNIANEVDNRRTFKKFWAKAEGKDGEGKYQLISETVVHVPPGQRLELSVIELCARDGVANEGCVPPFGKMASDGFTNSVSLKNRRGKTR